jgi:alpha-glucuronidase
MNTFGENGYRLWLRYQITNGRQLSHYRMLIGSATIFSRGATYDVVKSELDRALPDLLGKRLKIGRMRPSGNALVIGTVTDLKEIEVEISRQNILAIGNGYLIRSVSKGEHEWTIITAKTDSGVVNGVFRFLRLLQTLQDIRRLDICSRPRIRRRILCHWDNLDGSVERGYAGRSLWKWERLPDRLDRRYRDYARACASIGINGTVLNNVNAGAESLETGYLVKTAALANVLRPYGIQVYLSATFNAPERLGGLTTSDPRNPDVLRWWKKKVDEIYELIPDFGGFQVKAGSEGQPGPQEYGANQQDGANMLADALLAHGGIVLWRAFV